MADPKKAGYQRLAEVADIPRPKSAGSATRRGSPLDLKRGGAAAATAFAGQAVPGPRQKDKFVPLGAASANGEAQRSSSAGAAAHSGGGASLLPNEGDHYNMQVPSSTIFEDIEVPHYEPRVASGRITVMTIAEGMDRGRVEELLKEKYPKHTIHTYQEVVHACPAAEDDDLPGSDIFFFDYGTVVFWAMSAAEEQAVLATVVNNAKTDPLSPSEVEIDEFQFHYSAHELPHIQNDRIILNKASAGDHQVQLAISHALAQSTKLGIYEERLSDIVDATRHLPEGLARDGSVEIGRKEIARLIGQVFLQRASVNLLSTVMDTPEFFWSAPDSLQVLYKRVCEYLELDTRVEVLNTRFQVLQEMLDMLRDQQNNAHMSRLEWIVIWLIVVEVIVGLFEVAGLLGWTPGH